MTTRTTRCFIPVLMILGILLLSGPSAGAAYRWFQNDSWTEGSPFYQVHSFEYCVEGFGDRVCTVLDIDEDCIIDKIGVLLYGTEFNAEFHVLCFEGDGVFPDPGTQIPPPGVNPPYVAEYNGFWVFDLMRPEVQWQIPRNAGDTLVVCLMYMGLTGSVDVDLDICTDNTTLIPQKSLILPCANWPNDWMFGETYGLTHNVIIRAGYWIPDPTATVPPTHTPLPPTATVPTGVPTRTPMPPTATPQPTSEPSTYTPQPTYTPPPTYTGQPSYTPEPTSIPTATPPPSASPSCTGTPSPTPTHEPYRLPFFDDFEELLPWEVYPHHGDCLWHRETARYYSFSHSWAYNRGDPEYDYDTGSRNSSSLVSPRISLIGAVQPIFDYYDWIETETRPDFDICFTEISTDEGQTWQLIFQTHDATREWTRRGPFDLSEHAGSIIRFRFRFDTLDSNFNDFEGWYVDDVRLRELDATPTPTPYAGNSGVDLRLNGTMFYEGMRFLLELDYLNSTPDTIQADTYLVLDVYGAYWFWPSWTQEADHAPRTMLPRRVITEVIFDFIWPFYGGSFDGIYIWAAVLEAGTSTLIGDYDYVIFGCNR